MKDSFRHFRSGSAILLLAALPLVSSAVPRDTGIQGRTHVYTGPLFYGPPPVVVPTVVTMFPVATTFTVVSAHSGRVVACGSSDADGNFRLPLPPGRYMVVPDDLSNTFFCFYRTPEPFEVTVRPGEFTGAGFTYVASCRFIVIDPVFTDLVR
jgi:hypothetical protein